MYIRELSLDEFNNFRLDHPHRNFHQSIEYGYLKSENNYEYELIGFFDDKNALQIAALVLVKMVNGYIYAYIPEGFLADYSNKELIKNFTESLKEYYKKENIIFIKINPNIVIGDVNKYTKEIKYNENKELINFFESIGYIKVEEKKDSWTYLLPDVNAKIDLNNLNINNFSKNTKNKIRKAMRKGLTFELANENKLYILNDFVKKQKNLSEFYFNDYYNIFARKNAIDYFLIGINYENFIINSQDAYQKEYEKNEILNNKMVNRPLARNVNKKMNSDKTLLAYKNDIAYASKKINNDNKEYIAGALVIKDGNTASIIISGYNKKYKDFVPNYFLYYKIMEYYKNEYDYLDLNGLSSNLNKDSKYYGLNTFKIGFNPIISKYIGEFDLPIYSLTYKKLKRKGYLDNLKN